MTLLLVLLAGTVLVPAGVGLGTTGATVIGISGLAEAERQAVGQGPSPGRPPAIPHPGPSPSAPSPASARVTLGVEAVDAAKPGALVVGVHVPGSGHTAGLVRGDVLLAVGRTRIDSAADLARAVAGARSGAEITLMVRHRSGDYEQLTAVPGVST
jgi:S1-C subfamily serine protease